MPRPIAHAHREPDRWARSRLAPTETKPKSFVFSLNSIVQTICRAEIAPLVQTPVLALSAGSTLIDGLPPLRSGRCRGSCDLGTVVR